MTNVILDKRKTVHILNTGVWGTHTLCGLYAVKSNSVVAEREADCKRCLIIEGSRG